MDVRELPNMLLEEFESSTVLQIKYFGNPNQISRTVLKIYRDYHEALGGSPYLEIHAGSKLLQSDEEKGDLYEDTVFISWICKKTSLLNDSTLLHACRIAIRAKELVDSGIFEFPQYWVQPQKARAEKVSA